MQKSNNTAQSGTQFDLPTSVLAIITVFAFLVGLANQLSTGSNPIDDFLHPPEDYATWRELYLALQWLMLPLGAALLPLSLRHTARELPAPHDSWRHRIPGNFGTMFAIIFIAAMAFAPSATGYLIVTAITLGARHTVIWSVLGTAVLVASGNVDMFLPWSEYDTEALFSHDFWFVCGALFAVVIDVLLFYIIGLIVGAMRKTSWRRQRDADAAVATG